MTEPDLTGTLGTPQAGSTLSDPRSHWDRRDTGDLAPAPDGPGRT